MGASSHEMVICLDGDNCNETAKFNIKFESFPVLLEEEISASIHLKSGWKLKKGWVEGVNMYMGKTPLIIESMNRDLDEYNILFFLGSCSEPNMHWRMVTEWYLPNSEKGNNQTVTAYYDFYTTR